jgi:hypothetical protein
LTRLLLFFLGLILWGLRKEAVRLNFTLSGACMAKKIGDTVTGRIAPTNAAGAPAPVFSAVYVEEGDSYDVSIAPDGLSAVFTANSVGTGNVATVVAITKGGLELRESLALDDVESPVDEEAVALNFRFVDHV